MLTLSLRDDYIKTVEDEYNLQLNIIMYLRIMHTHTVLLYFLNFLQVRFCGGQYFSFRTIHGPTTTPLPFPTCKAADIDCQRRGLRTFFFLMDSGHLGMRAVDPVILNSVALVYPDQQVTFLLRRLNVTGARWTKLVERKFDLLNNRSGVKFKTDLHVTAEITVDVVERYEPYKVLITMDIQEVESNITYKWEGQRGFDNEDYLIIGQERIAVRNARIPTYFLQPTDSEDARLMNRVFKEEPSILENIANEIVADVMHSVVDNFRLFSSTIPVKYYYTLY